MLKTIIEQEPHYKWLLLLISETDFLSLLPSFAHVTHRTKKKLLIHCTPPIFLFRFSVFIRFLFNEFAFTLFECWMLHMVATKEEKKNTSNSCKSALSTQNEKWYRFWTACVCLLPEGKRVNGKIHYQSIYILDRICLHCNCLLATISDFNSKDVCFPERKRTIYYKAPIENWLWKLFIFIRLQIFVMIARLSKIEFQIANCQKAKVKKYFQKWVTFIIKYAVLLSLFERINIDCKLIIFLYMIEPTVNSRMYIDSNNRWLSFNRCLQSKTQTMPPLHWPQAQLFFGNLTKWHFIASGTFTHSLFQIVDGYKFLFTQNFYG